MFPIWRLQICKVLTNLSRSSGTKREEVRSRQWWWVSKFLLSSNLSLLWPVHFTVFSACICSRWLRFLREIENFLCLHWHSPLRKTQTSVSSVNQPLHDVLVVLSLPNDFSPIVTANTSAWTLTWRIQVWFLRPPGFHSGKAVIELMYLTRGLTPS